MDSKLHWYVGRTRSCQERKTAEALAKLGVEAYLPIQKVRRQWSDRIKTVETLLLPHTVFVHCDEITRRDMLSAVYGLVGYMMDRGSSERIALIVPDKQIKDFRFVVDNLNGVADMEVQIASEPIRKGDMVQILTGPLAGFECECVDYLGNKSIAVRLGIVGTALVGVELKNVKKL